MNQYITAILGGILFMTGGYYSTLLPSELQVLGYGVATVGFLAIAFGGPINNVVRLGSAIGGAAVFLGAFESVATLTGRLYAGIIVVPIMISVVAITASKVESATEETEGSAVEEVA